MSMNITTTEENRNFIVLGHSIDIYCDDFEYNHILMFLTNLHAFGGYYYDIWKSTYISHQSSSVYYKIMEMDCIIVDNLPYYEESVLKGKKRDYNIDSLLN